MNRNSEASLSMCWEFSRNSVGIMKNLLGIREHLLGSVGIQEEFGRRYLEFVRNSLEVPRIDLGSSGEVRSLGEATARLPKCAAWAPPKRGLVVTSSNAQEGADRGHEGLLRNNLDFDAYYSHCAYFQLLFILFVLWSILCRLFTLFILFLLFLLWSISFLLFVSFL